MGTALGSVAMAGPVNAEARAADEARLVAAARAGDAEAFRELTEPYIRELRVHCYRMLGSLHDAEDAVQETLLRAWRRLATVEGRAPFRLWLYRVATSTCLNAIRRRSRNVPRAAADTPEIAQVSWLEPFPETLMDDAAAQDPAARYELRESIALAFLAALQYLPPRQRAVLVLRDALGWAATEVAELLETSVPAVNSALQRARATLEQRLPSACEGLESDEEQRSVLERFVHAWERADIASLAALLREDAVLAMPPAPLWFRGPSAIGDFLASAPAGVPIDEIPLVETRANGRSALAAYVPDDSGRGRFYGVMAFDVRRGRIREIVGFANPELCEAFGLPDAIPREQ